MTRKLFLMIALALMVSVVVYGADKIKWLNIHVVEPSEETTVEVHVPLSLVHAAIASVKTEEFHDGKIKLDLEDAEIDLAELLKEIKAAPDGDYVKVHDKEADVLVTKRKGMILIDVTEKSEENAKVNVKIPAGILDAITVNEQNELDIKGVLTALEQFGTGDLVTVEADDAHVRIWIE